MNIIANIVAFKIGWLASVIGAANELPFIGPAVVMAVIGIHLHAANDASREFTLIVLTGAIGAVWDSVMVAAGWLSYPSGNLVADVAPYWIIAMWMLFATTLNVLFRWLQSNLPLASALGAVFGPLSYYGGAAAGAVVINEFAVTMTVIAAAWALLFPGLLLLAGRLDGVTDRSIITASAEDRRFGGHV